MKFNLLFLLLSSATVFLPAQSIAPLNAPFMQGQPLQFAYTGGTGSPMDWIGIYHHNETPGNIGSTSWQYITAVAGEIEFNVSLAPGFYDIHLFCCDGYQIIASFTNFEVSAEHLRSRLTFYKATDSIRITASEATVGDLVSIYHGNDFSNGTIQPDAIPVVQQTITSIDAAQMAKLVFTPLPPGAYTGTLLSGGQLEGYDDFQVSPAPVMPATVTRIGLGSCGNQGAPEPALENILLHDINFFLYTGDNLYIDTYDPNVLKAAYENFITGHTEFQKLRAAVPLIATWDDHDYGCCDEDADYPLKAFSQQVFLDFFEEPADSPRRTQEGIYTSYTIGDPGQMLQVIVLDGRYFLDDKRANNGCGINDYCPWDSAADTFRTFLGDVQWTWLKTVLEQPADLRIVVSSVEFSASYHGFESWRLFPHQRKKFQELVKETQAEHLFFVSGDMHYAEVSVLDNDTALYPLYDFTSSAINQSWPPEANMNRVDNKSYGDPNIGLVEIDWQNQEITFTTFDAANTIRFEHTVLMDELEFSTNAVHEAAEVNPNLFMQIPTPGKNGIMLVFEKKVTGEITLFDMGGIPVRNFPIENTETVEIPNLLRGAYVAEYRGVAGVSARKVLVE